MITGTVLQSEELSRARSINHGFFTREGGVSSGHYGTLNVGYGSDDERTSVAENRRRIAGHLGARFQGRQITDVITPHQIHSADVVSVEAPFPPGQAPKADALVTRTAGLAIGVLTADCTPVLFADATVGVVGAAHAGWRGAVSGILGNTVEAMVQLGASRSRITAAIGPVIRQNAYEVGPEFKSQFMDQSPGNDRFFTIPPGRERDHFDLPGYCHACLEGLGLERIDDLGLCTYENESLFFSYRRQTHRGEPDYGRQIAAIVVS